MSAADERNVLTMAESKNLLDTIKKLHFVGIGGSGMCPMAEILHHKGYTITGSDINESDTLERIRGYGIPVHMGHRAENIGDAELVVYTAAAKQDNPELAAAREKGVPTLERSVVLGKFGGVTVADDFAHHPTELSSVLSSAVRMGYHAVWAVFQPHTYSRTAMLLDDFAAALSIPDHVVMTEILAVRETNTYNIHTSDLAAKIPGSCWFDSFEKIADYVMAHAEENDLILTLGGGDIYKCANLIVEKYKNR